MAEQSFDLMTREQENRIAAGTAIGVNAVKPILQFQVSLLRLWADNIETFTHKYEKQYLARRSSSTSSSDAWLDGERQRRREAAEIIAGATHEIELDTDRTNVEQIER
jgi:hypothetical protein